jgi:hypothetical protein
VLVLTIRQEEIEHTQTNRASYTWSKKALFAPSGTYSETLSVDGIEELKLST